MLSVHLYHEGKQYQQYLKFFNTKDLPVLDLTESALLLLAEKSVHRGYTVPGVEKNSLFISPLKKRPG